LRHDTSLIETIVLILDKSTVGKPELLNMALDISKSNIQMERVLYNCLRDSVPEVRGFIGDGSTIQYCY